MMMWLAMQDGISQVVALELFIIEDAGEPYLPLWSDVGTITCPLVSH